MAKAHKEPSALAKQGLAALRKAVRKAIARQKRIARKESRTGKAN
jgi:hypothetical protein